MLWRVVERHFTTPWDRIGDSKSKVKITSFYVPCSSIFDKNVTSLICKVFFRRQTFIIFSKIMYLVWYFLSVSKAKISSGENTEFDVEFYNWAWQQGNVNFKFTSIHNTVQFSSAVLYFARRKLLQFQWKMTEI